MEIRRRPPNPKVKVANLEYSIPHSESKPRNILERIVWEKDREVKASRLKLPLEKLKTQITNLPSTRDFLKALRHAPQLPAVIAEIKKASPSKGIIRENFDPISISKEYVAGGASCISILTDKSFFQGGFDILIEVRKTVKIPLLCKDFIILPYQIYQARVAGADAILLIAAILSDQDLTYLKKIASNLSLSVLVEVHNVEEMQRILSIGGFPLIGINNRDLKTFETDIATTEKLSKACASTLKEQNVLVVSESGLFTRQDLDKVSSFGAQVVLVGESLMRQNDVLKALKTIMG